MAIRVLRLIEYTYKDEETAADDMGRWTTSHNWGKTRMRSATLPFEAVEWAEWPNGDPQVTSPKSKRTYLFVCSSPLHPDEPHIRENKCINPIESPVSGGER